MILDAVFDGIKRKEDELSYLFGTFLPEDKSPAARAYLEKHLKRFDKKISGKKLAGLDFSPEQEIKETLLSLLEETKC